MNKTERLNHKRALTITKTLDREKIQNEIKDIVPTLSTYNLHLLKVFAEGLSKNGYQTL